MESESRPNDIIAGAQISPAAGAPNSGYHTSSIRPVQQFSNPLDRFWNLYLNDAEKADKKLTDGWKGDADGILIFTGLFATTVGSFIIAVLPYLSPDPDADTVALLKQIAQQQISRSNGSQSLITVPSDSFQVSASILRVNILWMLSFFLSLCCALAATLVQQWTRQYLADSQPRGPPSKRGPVHAYLRVGIERFGFAGCVDFIVTLLHVSVFLFMGGLIEFTFGLHLTVAYSLLGFIIAGAGVYLTLTMLPALTSDCPYKTPLTPIIRPFRIWYKSGCSFILKILLRAFHHSAPLFWWPGNEESRRVIWKRLWDLKNSVKEIRSRAQTLTDLPRIVSCQRPSYVFYQMARGLDEDFERHQYLLILPSFFESLSQMRYPMKSMLKAGEWYSPFRQILASYRQRRISGSAPLSLQPLEDLIILDSSILATHQYLLRGSQLPPLDNSIAVSDWGSHIHNPLSSSLRKFMDYGWPSYDLLLIHENPAISLLSFCRMLSADLVYPLESSILDYDLPLDPLQMSLTASSIPTFLRCKDNLLLSFKKSTSKMANLYRLLYFTRAILHYGIAQSEPLKTYKHIWVPILHGLHSLTFDSELWLLSDETRLYIYELISVVGRDDLLPHSDLGLPPEASRHDYSIVFEAYPVLGGCLRSIVGALGLPTKYRRARLHHRASAPGLRLGSYGQIDPSCRRQVQISTRCASRAST